MTIFFVLSFLGLIISRFLQLIKTMVKSYTFEINLKNGPKNWQNMEKNPYIHILPLTHLFRHLRNSKRPRFQDAQMIRPKNLRG